MLENFRRQFGGRLTPERQANYAGSTRWQGNRFRNVEPVALTPELTRIPGMIYRQLTNTTGRRPAAPLPVAPFDREAFLAPSPTATFIWYGHSALLLRVAGLTVLIDPMLGPDTTPIAPFSNPRFSDNTLDLIEDFPSIDLVLLTHDHYDHLDLASILRLRDKAARFWVALGVERHLEAWGVPAERIRTFDWHEAAQLGELIVTFTPTQHFSGRGLRDRQGTLWGGWLLTTPAEKIWFSGDGGYNDHFREIGRRYGPIDLAFMECGQYNEDWRPVHLFPDESVRAAQEAGVRRAVPVHWAGFDLSYFHTWTEPAEAFVAAAAVAKLVYGLPQLGKVHTMESLPRDPWWRQ